MNFENPRGVNYITKQLIFASILFICTAVVVCVHLFGQPYTVPFEEISLPETTFFSEVAVIPPQSTHDNVKNSSITPVRIYGILQSYSDSMKLMTAVKIMLMLIALSLFIKSEKQEVEFILDSDGMK